MAVAKLVSATKLGIIVGLARPKVMITAVNDGIANSRSYCIHPNYCLRWPRWKRESFLSSPAVPTFSSNIRLAAPSLIAI